MNMKNKNTALRVKTDVKAGAYELDCNNFGALLDAFTDRATAVADKDETALTEVTDALALCGITY
jgi:hypothetical protein